MGNYSPWVLLSFKHFISLNFVSKPYKEKKNEDNEKKRNAHANSVFFLAEGTVFFTIKPDWDCRTEAYL